MKVLLINTSERIGGAAVACSRLLEALNRHGVKARMLVRDKQTDNLCVIQLPRSWRTTWRFVWERFVIWLHNRLHIKGLFHIDIANTGFDITRLPEFQEADVIHLHWVNQGMLSLTHLRKILESGKHVVWTMHDMWPCTGICHHARECTAYQSHCHHCPYLTGNGGSRDLSYQTFTRKQKSYAVATHPIRMVACSQWLAEQARKSALLTGQEVYSIPNPLNTAIFHPQPTAEARIRFRLPQDKQLLLFGSVKTTDKRKGIDYLVEACRLIASKHPELSSRIGVVTVGNHSNEIEQLLPFPVYPIAFTTDERQAGELYSAVDLYVTPSLEENLPNMIMEAMACGTPCVGFHVGGIPEMIDHRVNGYVAEYRNAADLAQGICQTLEHPDYDSLCQAAVHKVATHYSEDAVAKKYIALYEKKNCH